METNNTGNKKKSKAWIWGIIIPVLVIGGLIIIKVDSNNRNSNGSSNNFLGGNSSNKDGEWKLLSRSANNGDVSFASNNDFALNVNCKMTPNVDISGLQITFTFKDKNDNSLTTKTKVMGNVSKNTEYTITFALSEFSLTELFKLDKYYMAVTGGTVSYSSYVYN